MYSAGLNFDISIIGKILCYNNPPIYRFMQELKWSE